MRNLKSIRVDLNLTQEEMAEKLKMPYPTYQRKEQGRSPLLAVELLEISKLSGIPMESIEIPK